MSPKMGDRVTALGSIGYNGRIPQGEKGTVVRERWAGHPDLKFDNGYELECPSNSIAKI